MKLKIMIIVVGVLVSASFASGTTQYIKTSDGKTVLIRLVASYSSTGNYMHSDKVRVEKRNIAFDKTGVPMMNFRWGTYYYPITIAQYGLQHHALYLKNNDRDSYKKLILAADYFVQNQDSKGGWPVKFDHMFYKGRTEEIRSPWYSAMAQGQAMSLLVRSYGVTNDNKYLEAAKNGVALFQVPVSQGGVLRKFDDKYSFYEEYPTNPPSYVLNGFIYSLLGLYDVCQVTGSQESGVLYREGIKALKRMISYYDLGNRSSYDLTHTTTEGNPPNIARWGYHATHIRQLSAIYAIEKDEFFKKVLDRWIGYAKGISAKTN